MRTSILAAASCAALLAGCSSSSSDAAPKATSNATPQESPMTPAAAPTNFPSFQLRTLDGKPADLSAYKDKVVLIVNTASECGLTPQYKGLEALHRELGPKGLCVLGFPCNDFGGQEPGTPEQIQQFCSSKYEVSFPLFEKLSTKSGPNQAPLYAWLESRTGELPGWNFGKYLVAKDGTTVKFFGSRTSPDDKDLRKAIDAALAQ